MEEKRKKHFNVGEVKERILEYILRCDSVVKESDISDFLKNEYNQFDRATVNRHLHDLGELKCVTKVRLVKKSRLNYWDIEFKNLKNIKKEFSNIQLSNYTKAKNIIIKENFPDIQLRLYKKYFIHMSLFPSLFDTFLNNVFESMLNRALELWQINEYKDIINSLTDQVYERSFLLDDWLNPPAVKQIIEVSKDELETILAEIQYPSEEQNYDIKQGIVEQKLLEKLVKVVLAKRPDSTKEQVQKEVSKKIIDCLFYTSQDGVFEIVFYQHLRRYKIYDRLCKHLYENDFLIGKGSQDVKTFVDNLEKCIAKVNSEEMQAGIVELDALYDEWYEKCLQKR